MKKYIKNNTNNFNIEYEDNLPDESYVLNETEGNGIVDEWGDCMAWCEDCGLGLEYNLCVDNTTGQMINESAFYVMHFNPSSNYWDTDSNDFTHYEIDYSNPNWRENIKKFAINMLSDVINRR